MSWGGFLSLQRFCIGEERMEAAYEIRAIIPNLYIHHNI